jgi:acylphosphatase
MGTSLKDIFMLEMILIIHGRVQGVGYRHSIITQIENEQNMVSGTIWNKPNGNVEIIAQGTIEQLKDLRRYAREGSNNSEVREIEETLGEAGDERFDGFTIKY